MPPAQPQQRKEGDAKVPHSTECECRGLGIIYEPYGDCNCGSGEGCSQHSPMWMRKVKCPAPQTPAMRGVEAGAGQFSKGEQVRVDHERFHGVGIVEYVKPERGVIVGVKLENGNVWNYEAETVSKIEPARGEEREHELREAEKELYSLPPSDDYQVSAQKDILSARIGRLRSQEPPQDWMRVKFIQPEQRAKWEKRLAAGFEATEEYPAPDKNERAAMGFLAELKRAEQRAETAEQERDEAKNQAELSERFLNGERHNHIVSILAWEQDKSALTSLQLRYDALQGEPCPCKVSSAGQVYTQHTPDCVLRLKTELQQVEDELLEKCAAISELGADLEQRDVKLSALRSSHSELLAAASFVVGTMDHDLQQLQLGSQWTCKPDCIKCVFRAAIKKAESLDKPKG